MTLARTPVREKAKYFCKHLKAENPDYNGSLNILLNYAANLKSTLL